jgi:hypothetical protein
MMAAWTLYTTEDGWTYDKLAVHFKVARRTITNWLSDVRGGKLKSVPIVATTVSEVPSQPSPPVDVAVKPVKPRGRPRQPEEVFSVEVVPGAGVSDSLLSREEALMHASNYIRKQDVLLKQQLDLAIASQGQGEPISLDRLKLLIDKAHAAITKTLLYSNTLFHQEQSFIPDAPVSNQLDWLVESYEKGNPLED